ncbi:hypothetical protein VHEMI05724 [[Torrubiella] hemipterigena]|uniref:Uncharacterized protein n=1 Tax=[Torrubiella] hemipterigena TaxID=1531966 RepID=A0A0A1T500_9HYPO|nr:hypothetical protein VHEMI05724 [[Torrubiella] hemipterigena]
MLACQRNETKGATFTVNELNWFRRHAYNIGVLSCEKWAASNLIGLFKSCITLSQCYGDTHPLPVPQELSLMTMRCHFMLSSIHINNARNSQEDNSQSYQESRVHFGEYCKILETFTVRNCGTNDKLSSSLAEHIQKHMLLQTSMLYVFEFEAAVMLDDWSILSQIVQRAHICSDEGVYKAMGDCLLQSQAPVEVLSNITKLIVNQIYILETFDASRLAKYIRCLFQALLLRGEGLAIQLLDQAIQLARELDKAQNPFPALEARWMVATSFNRAVDHYVQGDHQRCKEWASRAIDLANYTGDDGLLKKAVESRYSELKLENESL